jgi:hypothetical protein
LHIVISIKKEKCELNKITWDDEENNTFSRNESTGKEDKKPQKCGDFKFFFFNYLLALIGGPTFLWFFFYMYTNDIT